MGNEFTGLPSHSAEWFGDARNDLWNEDFLQLLAAKWRTGEIHTVLDVGTGVGHWGHLLCRILPEHALVTGVDRDPVWVRKAAERAEAAGLSRRFRSQGGLAEALPFDDNSFDMVTCQTLLMHLREPERGLAEMIRVARPGGLILAAEPNNVLGPALQDAIVLGESTEAVVALLRFQLFCQRGKANAGEGNDLIGESLPALFSSAGLREVEVRLNDRASLMIPPYASGPARALAELITDFANRSVWMWNRADTRRYFIAGGGLEEEFEAGWASALAFQRRVAEAISAGRYACAGGGLFYLVWGRKPSPSAWHEATG